MDPHERRRPPYALIILSAALICLVVWVSSDAYGVKRMWDGIARLLS